jgi:hypothetical protein
MVNAITLRKRKRVSFMSTEFIDNSDEFLAALERATKNGLKAIGMTAEGHAKRRLTETVYTRTKDPKGYKLTGRLRNSITYALAGERAAISSYTDSENKTYTYDGAADNDGEGVYIGTNVVYAAGIETGSRRKAGAVHFLQSAAADHGQEYKDLMENSLKNA